ncbi:MAG: hypothetical protein AAGC88_13300, partial [Bacteroidota bacterium]
MKNQVMIAAILAVLSMTIISCGNDDSDSVTPSIEGDAIYAVLPTVTTPDNRVTYVQLTSELGSNVTFDPTKASLEIVGGAEIFSPDNGGYFLVASEENVTLDKYELDENDALVKSGTLSLAGVGTQWHTWITKFVSETKFYYFDVSQGQILVIDPIEMTINNTIELPEKLVGEVDGLFVEPSVPV